jgi:CPA2 family monovalent cation:H+ antiporter-2
MSGIGFIGDLAVVMVIAGGVGWCCQRIGLSVVVGYLIAGVVIGPYTPPFAFVADIERVKTLAQVGLVFLMFSIGLNLSLQRLRRLGFSLVGAAVISALVVFHGCRLLGLALGWSSTHSLFLSAMLMVCSSAIMSKILDELNATHQRWAQLALGVAVLEDAVAVVMLTLLSTLVQFGGEQAAPVAKTLGGLASFVVLLAIVSLLLVPRLLLRLTHSAGAELRTILTIGLMLALAWLANRAGYSPALGAFLLGVIVASTPHKPEIERVFEGLRDMFGAVFFVAMGMLFNVRLLLEVWPMVLGIGAFTLVWRPLAATLGLVLAGNARNESFRAGLALMPLGEFSFIIAQLGVEARALPEPFYALAIGLSLVTTLLAPPLIRRSAAISERVDAAVPMVLREWIAFYHAWLKQVARRQQRSVLWRLTGKRLLQTAAQILLVSALIPFALPVYDWLEARLGEDWLFPSGLKIVFWTGFGAFLLAPLVATWRNFDALAMIFAESATRGTQRARAVRPLVETALKTVAMAMLVAWLLALLPFGFSVLWALLVIVGILSGLTAVFWRRLVRWHSRLEIELHTQLKSAVRSGLVSDFSEALREKQDDWKLQVDELVVPDFAECAGRKIGELALRTRCGCSVVSIDRHGFAIPNPSADVTLYPRDKLLLLGSAEQIAEAARLLTAIQVNGAAQALGELGMEVVPVPMNCPRAGRTLAGLDVVRQVGVQIAGIQRGERRILTPSGEDRIEAGDELLVLGTPRQIQALREWLGPPTE